MVADQEGAPDEAGTVVRRDVRNHVAGAIDALDGVPQPEPVEGLLLVEQPWPLDRLAQTPRPDVVVEAPAFCGRGVCGDGLV